MASGTRRAGTRRRVARADDAENERARRRARTDAGDVPGHVVLSQYDKANALTFVDGPLTVRGHKGYCTVRATHGVMAGSWYYEVTVQPYDGDGAVRSGWSTRRADVETPVGYNNGFGLRHRTGEFVVDGRRSWYGEGLCVGDVLGCHIVLPNIARTQKKRILAAEKRFADYSLVPNPEGPPPAESGASFGNAYVQFFKNGRGFGIPSYFYKSEEDRARGAEPNVGMKGGTYYPSISLYFHAVASVNFGPEFNFAIPEGARPICELSPSPPAQPAEADVAGDIAADVAEDGNTVE